jgi:hypothetical protein
MNSKEYNELNLGSIVVWTVKHRVYEKYNGTKGKIINREWQTISQIFKFDIDWDNKDLNILFNGLLYYDGAIEKFKPKDNNIKCRTK